LATPLRLRVFKAGAQVECKDFDCSIIKIGRLSAAQLCLDDEKVSRIHAVIDVAVDGTFSIIDMGSVEGTFVNGRRINRGDLRFGDEIRVGNTIIHVEDASVAEEVVAVPSLPLPVAVLEAAPEAAVAAAAVVVSVSPHQTPSAEVLRTPVVTVSPAVVSISQEAIGARGALGSAKPVVRSPRRGVSNGGKPLGLEIRLMWGDQALESHYFSPSQKAQFVVGTASGVDFPMRDLLFPGTSLEVVSFDKGQASLQFTERMEGEFHADGKSPMKLSTAIQAKVAAAGNGAYSIDLRDSDFMWINLGDNVVLEAHMDTEPKPAWVPFLNRIDFSALNIFLVIALLGSLFVISALNMEREGGLTDELSADNARLVKLIEQSPDIQKNIQRKIENIKKSNAGEAAAKAKGNDGEMGRKNAVQREGRATPKGDPNDNTLQRQVLTNLLGAGSGSGGPGGSVLSNGSGGAAIAALGNLRGARVGDAGGLGGLGVRGVGSGGGGHSLNSIGIGGTGTKTGSSFGTSGTPGLAGRANNVVPELSTSDLNIDGNVDGELIRQVIRRNSSQIRACYEAQLIRYPKLAGRIAIRFVINSTGTVDSSNVYASTMNNKEMGSCVANKIRLLEFPRPKGGGTAQVTYPFIFKPTG